MIIAGKIDSERFYSMIIGLIQSDILGKFDISKGSVAGSLKFDITDDIYCTFEYMIKFDVCGKWNEDIITVEKHYVGHQIYPVEFWKRTGDSVDFEFTESEGVIELVENRLRNFIRTR